MLGGRKNDGDTDHVNSADQDIGDESAAANETQLGSELRGTTSLLEAPAPCGIIAKSRGMEKTHMPRYPSLASLDKTLASLVKQRQEHLNALALIDAIFAKYGINPGKAQLVATKATPTATDAAPAAKKRRRLRVSGTEFILGALAGGKTMTTAQISTEWKKANRPGKADQPLWALVKAKKIKREPVKDGQGSKHTLA